MFEKCPLKNNEECPYATISKGVLYCGLVYGKNKVKDLKKCPLKERKRKNRRKF